MDTILLQNEYKRTIQSIISNGMAFLSELFHNEKGNYGVIAVARSALSTIFPKQGNVTFGKDSNVGRMLMTLILC